MKTYNIKEFANMVNRSVKTLQRWDRDKKLIAKRTFTNQRYYTDEDIEKVRKGR